MFSIHGQNTTILGKPFVLNENSNVVYVLKAAIPKCPYTWIENINMLFVNLS